MHYHAVSDDLEIRPLVSGTYQAHPLHTVGEKQHRVAVFDLARIAIKIQALPSRPPLSHLLLFLTESAKLSINTEGWAAPHRQ